MNARIKLFGLLAALALTLPALPAVAHTGHPMSLICADPSPSTAGAHGTHSWCWSMNFGAGSSDRPSMAIIFLPVDTKLNEDGSYDGADPSDGEKVGEVTLSTDFSTDGCGDANDGGTYPTNWEDTWTAYTAPAGWTKVAQYNTVMSFLFFFTENMPTHAIKNNTTGQYALVIDFPESRWCDGASTSVCFKLYGYAQNNSSQEWVIKNPTTTGNHTVKVEVTEVDGTMHDATDTIAIT